MKWGHPDFKPDWYPNDAPVKFEDLKNPRHGRQLDVEYLKKLVVIGLRAEDIDAEEWIDPGYDRKKHERKQKYKRYR